MHTPDTPQSSLEQILANNSAIWVKRGLQATRLLQKKVELEHLSDLLPHYDTVAQTAGTVSVQIPRENSLDTDTEIIDFAQLLAERNDLGSALTPDLQTVRTCIQQCYQPNDESKPAYDTDLQHFLSHAADSHPYQYTLEQFYDVPWKAYVQNAVRRLENDKQYVPTDAELKRNGKSREETMALFECAIAALQHAYARLMLFQLRAKAVHEAVLPELQACYRQCAEQLAAICMETTDGIIDNPGQYFAHQQENRGAPHEMSLAFTHLRRVLMGLRSTDGRGGLSHAMTADENYIASFVQSALSKAGEERKILEQSGDPALLQKIDTTLAPAATGAPAADITSVSSPESVQAAGGVKMRRSLITKLFGG